MSLIKCPECGQEISDKAKMCPHCGYELPAVLGEEELPQQIAPVEAQSAEEKPTDKTEPAQTAPDIETVVKTWKQHEPYKGKVAMILWIVGFLLFAAALSVLAYFVLKIIAPMQEELSQGDKLLYALGRADEYKKQCGQYRNITLALLILSLICCLIANLWTPLQSFAWGKKNNYDFDSFLETVKDSRITIFSSVAASDFALHFYLKPKSKIFYIVEQIMLFIGISICFFILCFMTWNLGVTILDSYIKYGYIDFVPEYVTVPVITMIVILVVFYIPRFIYELTCKNCLKQYLSNLKNK